MAGQGEPSMTEKTSEQPNDMAVLIKHLANLVTDKQQVRIKEPNTYDGTRDALLIDGWIRSVERYATFHNWDQTRTCLLGSTLLRDRADAWYRTLENSDDQPTTWLELKRLLIDFFRPDNSVRIARDKLAVLKQTGNLVDYINQFMDIKLGIPTMTDEEACDKFTRGLATKQMRAHVRQYEAETLKAAVRAALSFDSAQQEENYSPVQNHGQQVDDPMEIDAIDQRRGNGYSGGNRRFGGMSNTRSNNGGSRSGYNSATCYYCHKSGHLKRNCKTRLADIRRLDEQHSQRRKRQDFQ
jgi:hypothetical protein